MRLYFIVGFIPWWLVMLGTFYILTGMRLYFIVGFISWWLVTLGTCYRHFSPVGHWCGETILS